MIQTNDSPANIPLTSNGIPIRNLWYMLSYSWNDRRLLNRWRSDVEAAPSIDGLLAKMLVNLVSQRMRTGLGRSYRAEERSLCGIRGRIDFATSLKKLSFQNAKAHCRFEIFDSNVLKNQIVRSTLDWVANCGDFGANQRPADRLRKEVRRTAKQLVHVDLIEVRPSLVKRQLLERDDHDYRLMLTICLLILSQQMPTEEEGSESSQEIERNWKFVWRLFESFVANFYRIHLSHWNVKPQKKFTWPTDGESSFLPVMKPDLAMKHKPSGKRVILDTKLTKKCLNQGQYSDKLSFSSTHTYQLYSYLLSQENELGKMTGVLLYPSVQYTLSESVSMQGHQFRWETIDLAQEWQKIESDLIAMTERF